MTVQIEHKLIGRTFVAVIPKVEPAKVERFEPSQTFYSLFIRDGRKWKRLNRHAFPLRACFAMFGSYVLDNSKLYSIRPASIETAQVNMRYGK